MTPYTATIRSEGRVMPGEIELLSIEVRRALDRIGEARLVVIDGSVAAGAFPISDSDFFAVGKAIKIFLRYGDDADAQIFSGLVVGQSVVVRDGVSELRVELKDAALALTRGRKSAVFRNKPDHEVIASILHEARVGVGRVEPTAVIHRELVQHNATDWDFILARADVNGAVVIVVDGMVSVRSMTSAEKIKATYTYGRDEIHEFELDLDGREQWRAVTSSAWDPRAQQRSEPATARPLKGAPGNLDVDQVAARLGGDGQALEIPAPLAAGELQAWADARLARSRLAQLRGRLVVAGDAGLVPYDRVAVAGIGERFNGVHLVSGVTQRVDQDGWWTELELGLAPEWFARRPEIADAPAAGLLPPATQLQLGVVDGEREDPEGEERVQVQLAGVGPIWARVARPDAGSGRGFCFAPERGDQVIVGFLAGDPRQPVILGALFGAGVTPPAGGAIGEENDARALVSRAGVRVELDDGRPALTLKTPAGNQVVLDDDAGEITIRDPQGNTITLAAGGITIKSAGDLALEAKGNVVIKGAAVDIQ